MGKNLTLHFFLLHVKSNFWLFLPVYELLDRGDCFHINLTLINPRCQVYILVSQFRGIQQILKLFMLLLKNIITWFYLNEYNQLQFKWKLKIPQAKNYNEINECMEIFTSIIPCTHCHFKKYLLIIDWLYALFPEYLKKFFCFDTCLSS